MVPLPYNITITTAIITLCNIAIQYYHAILPINITIATALSLCNITMVTIKKLLHIEILVN